MTKMTKYQTLAGLFGSASVAVISFLFGVASFSSSVDMPADSPPSSVNEYSPDATQTPEYEDPFEANRDRFDTSNPDSPWYDDGTSGIDDLCDEGFFSC